MKIDRHITWLILRQKNDNTMRILLGRKKSGFGAGKLVGIGGKVEKGESVEAAAARECKEEIGVETKNISACGRVVFDNLEYQKDKDGKAKAERVMTHLFIADDWSGEICASEEIEPLWLDARTLNYGELWEDAIHWMPYVLADEKIEAYFYYSSSSEQREEQKIDHFSVDLIPNLLIAHIDGEDLGLEIDEDCSNYDERLTTRAVLLDENNRVALISEANIEAYTLPGGGIENDEFIREALHREVREEAGYEIEILDELGYTIDERAHSKKRSINYAYLCRARDFVGTNLTEGEQEAGYELEWVEDIDEAIDIFENLDLDRYSARNKFKITRDMHVLMAAKGLIRGKYGA